MNIRGHICIAYNYKKCRHIYMYFSIYYGVSTGKYDKQLLKCKVNAIFVYKYRQVLGMQSLWTDTDRSRTKVLKFYKVN